MKKNENAKKINKKIIIIILPIVIGLLIILYFLINNLQINSPNNSNSNADDNSTTYFSVDEEVIDFNCSLYEPNTEKTIEMTNYKNNVYGVGDYVYCNIKVNNSYNYKINNMELEYNYGNNVELESINSITNNWSTEKNLGNIKITQINDDSDISDVYFKFYIKNNKGIKDSYKITIENLIFKSNNSDYKLKDNKIINLNTANERVVQNGKVLQFDKAASDGSFKTINKYNCADDFCGVNIASQRFLYENENSNIVMITDGEYNILFDKENGIIDTYGEVPQWLVQENGEEKYLYVNKKDTNKYGIVDKNGKIIKDFTLEKWPFMSYQRYSLRYSIENNMFVDIKNNKYGIIKLTSDDIIIDYIYDDLDLISSKYYKAKESGRWYVYDFNTQEKYIEEGYDYIHYASDKILIVEKDATLYLKDFNGKNIIDDTIKINKEVTIQAYTNNKIKNIIDIYVCNDEYCYELKEHYEYDISSNKLNKVNR